MGPKKVKTSKVFTNQSSLPNVYVVPPKAPQTLQSKKQPPRNHTPRNYLYPLFPLPLRPAPCVPPSRVPFVPPPRVLFALTPHAPLVSPCALPHRAPYIPPLRVPFVPPLPWLCALPPLSPVSPFASHKVPFRQHSNFLPQQQSGQICRPLRQPQVRPRLFRQTWKTQSLHGLRRESPSTNG